jgi:catechol 2,3-dioxygenase-like lactoylglutathione lyase family enzyme
MMIGYVTVGTKDLKKAGEFYDKLCGELGMGRFMANDHIIAWGGAGGGAGFGVALPFDGKPMTVGNGVMAAFSAQSPGRSRLQAGAIARRKLRRTSRAAQRAVLRRLFQGPRRQQAQRVRDGLI